MSKKTYIILAITFLLSLDLFGQTSPMMMPPPPPEGGTPSTPPNPTASTNVCGAKTLYRTGTPPRGETWFWQTSANGTSEVHAYSTYTANSSGTYYIRAHNIAAGTWSTGSGYVTVTVNINPPAPATPTFQDHCSSGTLTRGTPPSGVTWYWQGTSSSGTSTSDSSPTYTVYGSGTRYIRARNNTSGCWSASSTAVTYSVTPGPATPPTPLRSGNFCGPVTLSWDGTPPQFIRWCWQTSAQGTDMTAMTSNYTVSSTGTYYLRAYDLDTDCWSGTSQISVTINPHPNTPSVPTAQGNCGSSSLTRGTPPAGFTWYWQGTDPSGTNMGSSSTTYDALSSGTYYLRARNDATGCWSVESSSVGVTVYPLPLTPPSPVIVNACNIGILERPAHRTGETYFWQGTNANGTSMADSNPTYTTALSGTYYLRARNNTTGCWSGTSGSVVLNVHPLPLAPTAPTIENTCGYGELSREEPASGTTWYWQGTSPNGTSESNSDLTYITANSGTIYLRAKDNSTHCWSPSSYTTISINPAIGTPDAVHGWREESGTVNLSSALGANANNNRWYDALENGNLLSDGLNYAPYVAGTTTFYVASVDEATECESDRIAVNATVQPKPVIGSTGTHLTMGSNITLSVANNSYGSYSWKRDNIEFATSPIVAVDLPGKYTVSVTKPTMTGTGTSIPVNLVRTIDDQQPMNYVVVNRISKEGVGDTSEIESLPAGERSRSITYLGGLGNNLQTIISQVSPLGKDLVQTPKYDAQGRQLQQYLAYISGTDDSRFRGFALDDTGYENSEQYAFYQQATEKTAYDTKPFTNTQVEPSPLQRVVSQTGTGQKWHDNNKKMAHQYLLNRSSDNIRHWKVVSGLPVTSALYADFQLYLNITTDENGNAIRSFTDKLGRIVQKEVESETGVWLKTAYVYDDFGRISAVLLPEAVKAAVYVPTQADLDKWAFQYRYDDLGRMVESKSSGSGWTYTVYDILNRPVLSQNADQRSRNEWSFVKYDVHGRPIISGYKVITGSRTIIQSNVNIQSYQYEVVQPGAVGYSLDRTYPVAVESDLLSISYYDNYGFLPIIGWDAENHDFAFVPEQGSMDYSRRVKGLVTGAKIRILDSTTWLNSVQYYDVNYRPLQSLSENHFNGLDRSTIRYNDLRQAEETKLTHNGAETITVVRRVTYDHAGRITQIHQNINNAPTDQLVAQYEYNALGQLVDKKLHNTDGTAFLQSVDYRYNIRGWLVSINNAQLDSTLPNNDDNNDYFGMEFLYNNPEAGLNDQGGDEIYYNGNIAAIKWKGLGAGSSASDQMSYKFKYDKSGRLLSAKSATHSGTAWTKETGALNEMMTYDQNGNILSLLRNHMKHEFINDSALYSQEILDSLTYTYEGSQSNKLTKVEDSAPAMRGAGDFKDNADLAIEYTYDAKGNITADRNKGIDTVLYNILGKVRRVEFSDGRTITYLYDAAGNKLKMDVRNDTLQTTTDYLGGFVYQEGSLSFFSSPEGRVVKNETGFEYQYALADHQGNTRVVFTSATPDPIASNASFEGDLSDGTTEFQNVNYANIESFTGANHTAGGNKVIRMNQTYKIGPSKSVKVYPGDKIDIEVGEYHEGQAGFGTAATPLNTLITMVAGAFGGAPGGVGESGAIYSGVEDALTALGSGGNQGDARPAAYLNYILFDRNYNLLDMGWELAPATSFTRQKLSFPTFNVKEEGFIFVYLSYDNESNNWVYFDDFKVTHTKSNVIQYNEYYPFGLQTQNSWTRENSGNNFLYNAGSELNTNSGWYETFFRGYDAALGRFLQVDPLASMSSSLTPYSYAFNNPVLFNDPNGDYPEEVKNDKAKHPGGGGGCFNCHGIFSRNSPYWNPGFPGPTGGGSNGAGHSSSISAGDFIGQALEGHGGNWSNGVGMFYRYDNEVYNYYNVEQYHDVLDRGEGSYSFENGVQVGRYTWINGFQLVQRAQQGNDCPNCDLADFLRNTSFFGGVANPFYGAEAIHGDVGFLFVGAERDWGGYFILAGKDKGKLVSYNEKAGGVSPSAGAGIEVGRIDVFGEVERFSSNDLYGPRTKGWISYSYFGLAGAYSHTTDGRFVLTMTIQFGHSVSPLTPLLGPWSGGINWGEIEP